MPKILPSTVLLIIFSLFQHYKVLAMMYNIQIQSLSFGLVHHVTDININL